MFSALLHFLVFISRVSSNINRRKEALIGEFTVVRKGRMDYPTAIMFLDDIKREECFYFCLKHARCRTVNYNSNTKSCELVDSEFDDFEADTETTNWLNYGLSTKINGDWSAWNILKDCSDFCSSKRTSKRTCSEPTPSDGGLHCKTLSNTRALEEVKEEECFTSYANYTIQVHTSPKRYAGTEANVFIRLAGETCTSDKIQLISTGNSFDTGRVAEFKINELNVGKIKTISVNHDNTGEEPRWEVDGISITVDDCSFFFLIKRQFEGTSVRDFSSPYTMCSHERET